MKNQKITFFLLFLILLTGCATFSPSITGEYKGEPTNTQAVDFEVQVNYVAYK